MGFRGRRGQGSREEHRSKPRICGVRPHASWIVLADAAPRGTPSKGHWRGRHRGGILRPMHAKKVTWPAPSVGPTVPSGAPTTRSSRASSFTSPAASTSPKRAPVSGATSRRGAPVVVKVPPTLSWMSTRPLARTPPGGHTTSYALPNLSPQRTEQARGDRMLRCSVEINVFAALRSTRHQPERPLNLPTHPSRHVRLPTDRFRGETCLRFIA